MSARLALGTAQFGLAYGINNTRGQIPAAEVKQILQEASAAGIDTIDTAYAYGESERAIGGALDDTMSFRIVTKYPASDSGRPPLASWQESCERLGHRPVYGYLLHNYAAFGDRLHLVDFLQELREQGQVQRTGFSLYHPEELREIFDRGLPFEIVQVPFSVLDQRFRPYFPELHRRGVEVHTRSAFLQGLVFRDPGTLPAFFRPALEALNRLRDAARELQLGMAELCLGFCLAQAQVDRVVVGVDGVGNLRQNIACGSAVKVIDANRELLPSLALDVPEVLNPALWEK